MKIVIYIYIYIYITKCVWFLFLLCLCFLFSSNTIEMNPVQLIPSPATLDLENMTFLNSLSFNFLNVDICVFDYIYKCVTALDTNMIK
jgi:hypothetical protein